ncbi:hypothetical protein JRO89_XS05G0033100 [Xanthoceras sorbifolium]|uniref:RNase H type-1 domain-containing protein n=1 Tax=Xanthoceras sorbifolium TaxID=99658 RepID=A0ABQ8I070_9ROSI|nr:hypothetical protein JRO89_XS05G0033100 [Xanthoceras sorbifolium]
MYCLRFLSNGQEFSVPNPTSSMLNYQFRKRIGGDPGCPAGCGKAETSLHAVWGCKLLRQFRANCGWRSLKPFVLSFGGCGSKETGRSMFSLLFRSAKSSLSIGEVMDWSSAFLLEFQDAAVIPSTAAVQDRAARCWSPPAAGLWKINTDAALDLDRGLVGIGVVVRDHQGLVCGSSAQCIRAHFSPLVAEGTALLRGLLFAVDLGVPLASVESDSAVLVCKKVAHALVKLALSLESNLFMMNYVPLSAEYVAWADSPEY